MFVGSVGALNRAARPEFVHTARKWPKKDDEKPETPPDTAPERPGIRRAAEPTIGKKPVDPLAELAKEVLGE
jgi:hypothetical protein